MKSLPDQAPTVDVPALRRKVAWRVLPLVIILYIIAYLDRANVAFAKLRMGEALGFSEEVFGFGIGVFFIGYLFLEIPGALLVERWSARKWFARILITWGLISAGMAFVKTPTQFYWMRFFLGVAEAGFFPGIIVYFSHWFVQSDRSRALSWLLVAVPFSLALGAPVSSLLLDVEWFSLDGWQWLFIVEGLPAVLLGVIVLACFTDRPRDAKWLTRAERDHLENELAAEAAAKESVQKVGMWQALRLPAVWLLAVGVMIGNSGGYAMTFWLPTTVKNLSGGSDQMTLLYSGIYYACGIASVLVSGWSADRSGDRKWHAVGGMIATGLFLLCSTIPGQGFATQMIWLCLTALGAFFWIAPFWTLPSLTLTASAAAAATGLINMGANLAGYAGNHVTGWLRQQGYGESQCLQFLAACFIGGGLIISFLRLRPRQA
ncbi:MAG: MFS transporter [Verrucomicrobia bacterium]|jgi:ACS family tartrate transporter-like MFS transporter|nr:MFS transporter [Verrucomicrobiota bacterium]